MWITSDLGDFIYFFYNFWTIFENSDHSVEEGRSQILLLYSGTSRSFFILILYPSHQGGNTMLNFCFHYVLVIILIENSLVVLSFNYHFLFFFLCKVCMVLQFDVVICIFCACVFVLDFFNIFAKMAKNTNKGF